MSDSALHVPHSAFPVPLPNIGIATRIATMDDLPFIDQLQKMHSRQLGFFPRAQMEGYIREGWVIVAEEARVDSSELIVDSKDGASLSTINSQPSTLLGYCASRDRYLKRDELGAIFQLCVAPGRQRGLIGANLLKSVFERASYGTRLFCCWCAQDLEANYFWEAMGFVPLAFRTGGRQSAVGSRRSAVKTDGCATESLPTADRRPPTAPRVHIFWQKRIREGDVTTPWWFPSQTGGGSIREDRLVFPIPPGVHWKDVMPVVLPGEQLAEEVGSGQSADGGKCLPGKRAKKLHAAHRRPATTLAGGLYFAVLTPGQSTAGAKREKQPKRKHDPKLTAAARELRDRWLEKVNETPILPMGKYEVSRELPAPEAKARKRLAA